MSQADKVIYTGRVHTEGGRNGTSRSDDGRLDIQLSQFGNGPGTNPEQLFAAGWSACFIGAMTRAAQSQGVTLPGDTSVDAEVDLVMNDTGFFLRARLNVRLPGLAADVAQAIVEGGHKLCPYSKSTRGNVDVTLAVI